MINKPKHILISEDDFATRESIRDILIVCGHQVSTARNGREALDFLRNNKVDLLLLDIILPDINGFEVIKAIRANVATNLLPVIFLSSESDPESKIEAIRLGANDYLVKPFVSSELCSKVKNMLVRRTKLRERFHTAAGGKLVSEVPNKVDIHQISYS